MGAPATGVIQYQGRAKISATLFDVYKRSLIRRCPFSRFSAVRVHRRHSLCKSRALNGSAEKSELREFSKRCSDRFGARVTFARSSGHSR